MNISIKYSIEWKINDGETNLEGLYTYLTNVSFIKVSSDNDSRKCFNVSIFFLIRNNNIEIIIIIKS